MKNIYMFTAAFFVAQLSIAQDSGDTLTFESLNLTSESYYNGSDEAGQIPFNDVILSNSYDVQFSSWSGFAVSNVTDNTTAGYGNQYSSFTGSGQNSTHYGVYYSNGVISFNQPRQLQSLAVSNDTYAAISMRDGDAFGKQFGSTMDANGTVDGTNGEDFFLLQIIPLDATDALVGDTVDFYLADYRFTDNTNDYIIDTWETIDFTASAIVASKIKFQLTSSDNGQWGMNTPAYFVIDNLVTAANVGLQENEIEASVYPNPATHNIKITMDGTTSLSLVTMGGKEIMNSEFLNATTLDISALESGIYLLQLSNNKGTVTKRIVKN